MTDISDMIDAATYADQTEVLESLVRMADLSTDDRAQIVKNATKLVRDIRASGQPGLMEVFLAEYGLSTDEGIALMCLAEALLRVPDAETIDALIEDKIAPSDWQRHLGRSTSSLVNASTWALMLTGRVLEHSPPGPIGHLRSAIKRLGEPFIRTAVGRAMKEMGRQFVLGESIEDAMSRAKDWESDGYTYSYDMLGEAALTDADARRYHLSYSRAISAIAKACQSDDIRENPGISVKLSALHPRYERAQETAVMRDLVPSLRSLALIAKSAGMGLNVDAEEADRLSLSLDVIDAVLAEPALAGWDGFGIVVQAYGPRAGIVIDTVYDMAKRHDRRIMVRLVKGAYWDTEIKNAQVAGAEGFPVFSQKAATDVSYVANARKLLGMTDRIYPQFATHNAHTVAAILLMANGQPFEFQRLHGMGEVLHDIVLKAKQTKCRIYAPVGAHRDLLAYLVRRLLENGANSSFVNQIVDEDVPPEVVAADPFDALNDPAPHIPHGPDLFQPERANSKGFDLWHTPTLDLIETARHPFAKTKWSAAPLLASQQASGRNEIQLLNPADHTDLVGTVIHASQDDVEPAFDLARIWQAAPETRASVLIRASELYEEHFGEIFALLSREAGKTQLDAVAEVREAVDFLRYYASQITDTAPAGTFVCISPWNFPLAIFTGQIAGALAAGNAVLAKPAEQTPLIAYKATQLLHQAGVPKEVLQFLPGDGATGAALTRNPAVNGVAFTGSTQTALKIRASLASFAKPGTPLIAETGGLNAMIVDSTALPEQAVRSIVESAFQSAGQRCSALRCLYVQEDIAKPFIEMLTGAMDALQSGDPWTLETDIGPVIDASAQDSIAAYVETAKSQGRLMHTCNAPKGGTFIAPCLIRVDGIKDLTHEVFGPVLHLATFRAQDLDAIIDDINDTGYGLTFGLHTRIDDRVQYVTDRIQAGNVYVNRNQIGAIVGSQPFGGTGLSGTGPKAGGPDYLLRFSAPKHAPTVTASFSTQTSRLPESWDATPERRTEDTLPGPTGELNRIETWTRPPILCLGPGEDCAQQQAKAIRDLGGHAILSATRIDPSELSQAANFGGVMWWGDSETARALDVALSQRRGPIVPLITSYPDHAHVTQEHHLCVDTTASGGNAALLGAAM